MLEKWIADGIGLGIKFFFGALTFTVFSVSMLGILAGLLAWLKGEKQ